MGDVERRLRRCRPDVQVYFLSLGSNKGDRRGYLREAISYLANVAGLDPGRGAARETDWRVHILAVASLYETSPVGYTEQPDFLNTVVAVGTDAEPPALLALCKRVEAELGRATPFRWGPREIDLDIIWWGEVIGGVRLGEGQTSSFRGCWVEKNWESPALIIPHPRATERLFVLVPLAEIAPGLPLRGQPVESWIARCQQAAMRVNYLREKGAPVRQQVVQKIAAPDWYGGIIEC